MRSSIILLFFLTMSCSSTGGETISIVTAQNAKIATGKGSIEAKANSPVEIPLDDVSIVESEGMVPAYLIPSNSARDKSVSLSLRPLSDFVSVDETESVYRNIGMMIEQYNAIQKTIAVKDYPKAEQMIKEMKQRHPRFHYINFLHANLLILMNRKDEGVRYLEEALRYYPDHQGGKDLLSKLKNKEVK